MRFLITKNSDVYIIFIVEELKKELQKYFRN